VAISDSSSLSSGLRDAGNGVFYSTGKIATAGPAEIAFLKGAAAATPTLRSRLCLHATPGDAMHDMLIVQRKAGYIRPHRHRNKSESFHVIEGRVTVVIFKDDGTVDSAIELGPPEAGAQFFYRMPAEVWHGFIIQSDWLVFHESSAGPFDPSMTEYPDWAPDEADLEKAQQFLSRLKLRPSAAAGRCRLCHELAPTPMIDLGLWPIAHRLLSQADAHEERFPFALAICEACGLVQVPKPIDPEILYRSFNYNFSSWKVEPHMTDEIDTILRRGVPDAVIDVGCNDGLFLEELRKHGVKTLAGIEPNPVAAERARARGLRVFNDMIGPALCDEIVAECGRFDLVVSRQVFEHVSDVDTFLSGIHRLLNEGGRVFIDVPDFGPSLRLGDCTTLWEEHVNYFTEETLTSTLLRHGLVPVQTKTYDFSGGCLAVVARRGTSGIAAPPTPATLRSSNTFADRVHEYGRRLQETLTSARGMGTQCVLYGTGVRGCALGNTFALGNFMDFAVDDQRERQGKFMPGTRLPILPSEMLADGSAPIICILAVNNENVRKVRERVQGITDRPVHFISPCGPSDIWAELEELESSLLATNAP
jgi:cupin fold WbuC family metalloprotein